MQNFKPYYKYNYKIIDAITNPIPNISILRISTERNIRIVFKIDVCNESS